MVPLITLHSLNGKSYKIATNFVIPGLIYHHETSMFVVDKNIVIQAYELHLTKNKHAEAIDVQCWYDDRITAIVTVKYKKQIPVLLLLIAERGELIPN